MSELPNTAAEGDVAVLSGPPHSPSKAWLRALELTAPISRNPARILPVAIEEAARKFADEPALLSARECLTYRELAQRANRYARWALNAGLAKGEVVCLLMPNRPEYLAIWLGITRVGGVAALLNTNLAGPSLGHSATVARPKHVIVAAELMGAWEGAAPDFAGDAKVWVHGAGCQERPRIDLALDEYSGETLADTERPEVTIEDRALYVYTSGTTGLPKAANVSHGRLMQWSHWFAGMMGTRPADRLYNCLPMYHSTGGVLATGAVLITGGSVAIREKFSAQRFWDDVVRWDCTLFQYIGELCRYLLQANHNPFERRHQIRMCCGNGLRPDIWSSFKERFGIPQILEFYASTEGNVSLFNMEGKPGAIGRVPRYLAHRPPAVLVQFDVETNQPVRNSQGFCIRCTPHETGEAIGQVHKDSSNVGTWFEGYTNQDASEKKIVRNVFEAGDAWYRTGDLMRMDQSGFYYFVDRIGDTFRWKGENVSASEVAEALCAFPGIQQAVVYGVALPGCDGRAGMATLAVREEPDFAALRKHLFGCLPAYAVPLFLRIRSELEATATFKCVKTVLQREGYDPAACGDPIWFHRKERQAFVPLDRELYEQIQRHQIHP